MTGAAWIDDRARRTPDGAAVVARDAVWSWRDLDGRAAALAVRLVSAGVGPGDPVAMLSGGGPDDAALFHATAKVGATFVPLVARASDDALRRADALVGFRRVAADARTRERAAAIFGADRVFLIDDGARPETLKGTRPASFRTCLFTSGTTGDPKGVFHSAAAHEAAARASARRLGTKEDDSWLSSLPLGHIGGLSVLIRSVLDGFPVVLEPRFDAARFLERIEELSIRRVSLVPTMLHRVLEAAPGPAPESLRSALLGGAAADAGLIRRALDRGWPLLTTYGMTETASQVTTGTPRVTSDGWVTSGTALPGFDVSIESPGADGFGEIVVRSRSLHEETKPESPAPRDGFPTGDLGRIEEDGSLVVSDRRDDRIVTGGENVSPLRVERTLMGHEGVVDAAVVGLPDPEWGNRVVALVVPREPKRPPAANDVIAWCRERLAGFEAPKEIRFVDSLPRTPSGKLLRREIGAAARSEPD